MKTPFPRLSSFAFIFVRMRSLWIERNLRNAPLCYPNIKFESSGLIRADVSPWIAVGSSLTEFIPNSNCVKQSGGACVRTQTRRRGYRKLQRSARAPTRARVLPMYTLFSRTGNRGLKYHDPPRSSRPRSMSVEASPREHNLRKLGFSVRGRETRRDPCEHAEYTR